MPPLFNGLLGNGSKDRDISQEMREFLEEMQRERVRGEMLVQSIHAASARLEGISSPITKAASEVDAVATRLKELEERSTTIVQLHSHLPSLNLRAENLTHNQKRAEEEVAKAIEDAQRIRSLFEELSKKVDLAAELKERLGSFMEVEKPLHQLREDAQGLRSMVDTTVEQITRIREQNDRFVETHKSVMSKMEAVDRRFEEMERGLADREQRIKSVESAINNLNGAEQRVQEVKREIGTLKALGDSVAQKTAALEVQRDAVERAVAQAEHLERAMRQIDAGVRQQQENEKILSRLMDQVTSLRSLNDTVVERSREISQLQQETEEKGRTSRQELAAMMVEMKKATERFEFENHGLDTVSQRVTDLRGSLADCESRLKSLNDSSCQVTELQSQVKNLTSQIQSLSGEIGQIDQDLGKVRTMRREMDETAQAARDASGRLAKIEESRPAVEVALRDFEQLKGTHAMVKDALERATLAQGEIARARENQVETQSWLTGVEKSVAELKSQVVDLNRLAPTIEVAQKQSQRLSDSLSSLETRRELVDGLQRQVGELRSLADTLDERSGQAQRQLETSEQRIAGLGTRLEDADRLSGTIASLTSQLSEAERRSGDVDKKVSAIVTRCESVEELAERTRALRPEIEQRHHAVQEAAKELQGASALRKEAAEAAQQLEQVTDRLTGALSKADQRTAHVDQLTAQIEERASDLRVVEKEIARSLEQIATRHATIQNLQGDLDRMFLMAERTATDVREIRSAHQEMEQSRALLTDVVARLREVRDTSNTLDDRKRQLAKAEERLARAEAVLVDVRSSLEMLQGQKAIVDLAVEKAGSLKFLIKQAEAAIEGLREEREMTGRIRAAVDLDAEDGDKEQRKAA